VRGRSVGGGGCSATLTGAGKRVNAVVRAHGARGSADNEHGAPHEVRGAPFGAARRPEPCYITGRDSAFWRFSTTPMLSPVTSTGTFQ